MGATINPNELLDNGLTRVENAFLELSKEVTKKKPSNEPEEHQTVRSLISVLDSCREVEKDSPKSKYAKEQTKDYESRLRNTFGLLAIESPFLTDIVMRRKYAVLLKEVQAALPTYLPDEIYDPEAAPEVVPADW